MIERRILRAVVIATALLFATGGIELIADHAPGDGAPEIPSFGVEAGGHIRMFLDFGDLDAMAEYTAVYESDRTAVAQSLMAGGYYRLHRNVKAGAFYRLGLGQRHDDDWIKEGADWIWRDTTWRPEHTFIADLTPRFLVPFLPGEDWVLSVKTRYEFTLYNEGGSLVTRNTALIRPGLTWFWIRDRAPVLNVALNYATYLSLDFGETWWYRHGPYLNVAYHLSPFLIADLSIGTQWIYWTPSAEFVAEWPGQGYTVPIYRPWTIDLGIIYRPRG